MKILAERKIRHLFYLVFLFAVGLILFSAVVTGLKVEMVHCIYLHILS